MWAWKRLNPCFPSTFSPFLGCFTFSKVSFEGKLSLRRATNYETELIRRLLTIPKHPTVTQHMGELKEFKVVIDSIITAGLIKISNHELINRNAGLRLRPKQRFLHLNHVTKSRCFQKLFLEIFAANTTRHFLTTAKAKLNGFLSFPWTTP